ncbi:hypothetical protein [Halosimplex pelagicum]|uniref:Uncharacterized protein n=1 Tax=Halosimplex pelagicum TaxID=869886 RepID=A0A7D5TGA3_9EURY|nr:hypothetical protein [Halosimplex pelagicum]QLH81336.1 hypothetical protein HZS54_06715 [Halosimplex pelagicum]
MGDLDGAQIRDRPGGVVSMPEILPQLFSSYVEIHTLQLGALLGLFVGLVYRDYPVLAYALLFLGVLSAFGNASHIGYLPNSGIPTEIERKPWYFLSALYATTVVNILCIRYKQWIGSRLPVPGGTSGDRSTSEDVRATEDRA